MTTLEKLLEIRRLKNQFSKISKKQKLVLNFIRIFNNIITVVLIAVLIFLECFYGYRGIAKNIFITCIASFFLILHYNIVTHSVTRDCYYNGFAAYNGKVNFYFKELYWLILIPIVAVILYFIWFSSVRVRIIGNIVYWSIVILSIIFPCLYAKVVYNNYFKYKDTTYRLTHEMVELAGGVFIFKDKDYLSEMIEYAEDDLKHGIDRDIKTLYNKAIEWEKTLNGFEKSLDELFEIERENDYKALQEYQEKIELKYEVRKLNDQLKDLKDELDRYK